MFEICHAHWLTNHAFTGACAGNYACAKVMLGDCSMSHTKPVQAISTSAHCPVVKAIDCWTEGWGIKSQHVASTFVAHMYTLCWRTDTSLAKCSKVLITVYKTAYFIHFYTPWIVCKIRFQNIACCVQTSIIMEGLCGIQLRKLIVDIFSKIRFSPLNPKILIKIWLWC
jgi:hypothetical protein